MNVEVSEQPLTALKHYASVPSSFEVNTVLDVAQRNGDQPEFILKERRLEAPYVKDYDALFEEQPAQWPNRFDVSNWGVFIARAEDQCVGGAVVAFDTPGMRMLEGRRDVAVLWDIRVAPEVHRQGIGSALFRAIEAWAKTRGCRQLWVETQNNNIRACRFYAGQGCVLAVVNPHAYPELPDEIQLLWHKALSDGPPPV